LTTALSVVAALLVLSLLVMIHELGHFLAGRALGFSILEFAIGMGPVLWKTTKNGIQYSVRALPIGGMCRFNGEDEKIQDGRSFYLEKVWKRIVVVLAGPLTNLLFAFVAAIVTLSVFGDIMPQVYEVSADSAAYTASMQQGDIIVAVDGKRVMYYNQTVELIQAANREGFDITVVRDGAKKDLHFTDTYDEQAGKNVIGITINGYHMKFSFGETISRSAAYIVSTLTETFKFFGSLFQGDISSQDVSGPVGIITYISEAVRSSGETVLRLVVLISASLGIMNLLPIPALDGGRLFFMVIEVIRGKAVPPEKEGMVHFVGLILLFGLMIFLTYNDIANLIRG
jgi:regulator of sigma E protease